MTTKLRVLAAAAVVICGGASGASAQEKGAFGLMMGYPTSFGAVWHLSNGVALRPEVTFSAGSLETSDALLGDAVATESDNWHVGFGISALFYQRANDRLRTYFTPKFAYERVSSTTSFDFGIPIPIPVDFPRLEDLFGDESEVTLSNYSFSGAFGGQYALNDRFSLFGEVGLEFTTISGSTETVDTDGWNVGLRSAVGVILYFR